VVAEQPKRLPELQRLWLIEATKYDVLPLDDRGAERLEPTMAGRPTLIRGDSHLPRYGASVGEQRCQYQKQVILRPC
jgi:hypothetical protein